MRLEYSGPLPPAAEFAKYEGIFPGAAERILVLAENESAHRHEQEKVLLPANIKLAQRGNIYGFIIGMTGILVSGYLIDAGHELAGGILGALDILGLVGVFLANRISK